MKLVSDRRKVFWIILAIILLIGAIPRVLIYDYSLPYIDHPDEPSLYLLGQQWRGLFEFPDSDYHKGYPPIYPAIDTATQIIMEKLGDPVMGDVIGVLRLLSVVFSILTGLFMALIARTIIGDVAAWLTAAFWSLSPILVLQGPEALSDPFAFLAITFSLWLAVIAATDKDRRHFAVWSVLSSAIGIFIKYTIAPVLTAGGLVILWVFFMENRRQGTRYIVYSVLIVMTAFVLLWLNGGLSYSNSFIDNKKRNSGFDNLLRPDYALNNIKHAVYPLEPVTLALVVAAGILGLVAFLVARKQQRPCAHIGGVAVVVALAVVQPWAVTALSVVSKTYRLRDVVPATSAIAVVLSVALVQIAMALPKRWVAAGQSAIVVGVSVLVFVPQFGDVQKIVRDYTPLDTRVELRAWSETMLEPGWVLVGYETEKVFNNYWSGMPGAKWFNWLEIKSTSIVDTPLDEWRERDIIYAVITKGEQEAIRETPEGQAYLDDMLLLRDFYEPQDHRGPTMSVFRLWRMEEETDVRFGEFIRLVGYDWDDSSVSAGDTLTFSLYWQADRTPQRDYSLFVHITPLDDRQSVVQWDGPPAMPARPTYSWHEPTETLVGNPISITLPADIPAGTYRVLLGIYDYTTGERLPVTLNQEPGNVVDVVGGDSLALKTITIR